VGIKVNIGIFGGTFDPIHLGHIEVAKLAISEINLDKVIFVPARCPQLKTTLPKASPQQRLDMVKLATGNEEMFQASDIEIKRDGPTFTFDTLEEIKESCSPKTALWFIVGSDAFSEFDKWENYEGILRISKICVVRRRVNNQELDQFRHIKRLANENNLTFINRKTPQTSSSRVREMMEEKNEVKKLLDPKVYNYIIRNELYGNIKDN